MAPSLLPFLEVEPLNMGPEKLEAFDYPKTAEFLAKVVEEQKSAHGKAKCHSSLKLYTLFHHLYGLQGRKSWMQLPSTEGELNKAEAAALGESGAPHKNPNVSASEDEDSDDEDTNSIEFEFEREMQNVMMAMKKGGNDGHHRGQSDAIPKRVPRMSHACPSYWADQIKTEEKKSEEGKKSGPSLEDLNKEFSKGKSKSKRASASATSKSSSGMPGRGMMEMLTEETGDEKSQNEADEQKEQKQKTIVAEPATPAQPDETKTEAVIAAPE